MFLQHHIGHRQGSARWHDRVDQARLLMPPAILNRQTGCPPGDQGVILTVPRGISCSQKAEQLASMGLSRKRSRWGRPRIL